MNLRRDESSYVREDIRTDYKPLICGRKSSPLVISKLSTVNENLSQRIETLLSESKMCGSFISRLQEILSHRTDMLAKQSGTAAESETRINDRKLVRVEDILTCLKQSLDSSPMEGEDDLEGIQEG